MDLPSIYHEYSPRLDSPRSQPQPTRRSTNLSSNVNLPHAIIFSALCGANVVTQREEGEREREKEKEKERGIEREKFEILSERNPRTPPSGKRVASRVAHADLTSARLGVAR